MNNLMPSFDIILTIWNRFDYTKRTIASLISSGAVADCERFIIVDNRSTEEGMQAFLHDLYANMPEISGKVWMLRRGKNDGWATAVNDALGLSRAEYIFLTNNDVEYFLDFHKKMFESFAHYPTIGLLGVWRHTGHGLTRGGINDEWFRDMDNVPAVGWMMPKKAMQVVGMLPEHGVCLTKGGNGEDTAYVNRMKQAGFLTGVLKEDIANHYDGY
jgi:GT2 family glycosyltransferase